MKKILILLLTTILVLALASCSESNNAAETSRPTTVELTTPSGPIQGIQTNDVSVYKGIPYAAPPVGDLRFAPTQPVIPWTETLDCTKYGPTAIQAVPQGGLPMSEDCLTLNVWTSAKGGENLPVYVFIHGGAFVAGTGALPTYDGANFAKDGIVAVTINYRLGGLGYYASQETLKQYGTTGNWSLLDQIEALKWIQNNIEVFGGDPGRVTIGGESAGSYSVSALMLSPLAEGLFHNAIMESGSVLEFASSSYYGNGDLEQSIDLCNEFGLYFGENDDAARLSKMREANAGYFLQVGVFNRDMSLNTALLMLNCYDGKVLPKDPVAALKAGQFNKVNLLVGYNTNEGSMFLPEEKTSAQYEMVAIRNLGYDRAQDYLTRYPVDDAHNATERGRQLIMDTMFSTGTKEIADHYSKQGQDVYFYRFDFISKANAENNLGASHASELPLVFGNFDTMGDKKEDQRLTQMSEQMHNRWVNFIKTGNPNGDGGVVWPKFDRETAQVLRFNDETTAEAMPDLSHIEYMQDLLFVKPYYELNKDRRKMN